MLADKAYVESDKLVLDPSLLEKSVIERLPDPAGWRMLVLPYRAQPKSKGGIHLTKATVDQESLATVVAYVLKMGPLCFNDEEKYGPEPWCKEKQWVLIGRYSGSRFRLEDGEKIRIINDVEVIGTILNPDDIVSL